MTLQDNRSHLLPGGLLSTREASHAGGACELRKSVQREVSGETIITSRFPPALRFRDRIFRGELALNLQIGFFPTKTIGSGDQGFWEA